MIKKNDLIEITITGTSTDGFGIGRTKADECSGLGKGITGDCCNDNGDVDNCSADKGRFRNGSAGNGGLKNGFAGDGRFQNDSASDGMAVFVDGALPGDKLLVRLVKVKSSYAYGKIEKIIVPSPYRKSAAANNTSNEAAGKAEFHETGALEICPLFSRCGGCQWQHCDYSAQLQFKKDIVYEALVRIGKIDNPPVEDVIGMDVPYHYRGKSVFPIGHTVGVFAPRSHRIIPVTHCNIQHPAHEKVIEIINGYIEEFRVPPYNEETHTGLLRHLMVRTGFQSGDLMVSLTVNGKEIPCAAALISRLTDAGVTTVVLSIHTARGNSVMGERFRVLSGSGFIREQIGHVNFRLSARSFFQVNPAQTKILYDKAAEAAGLNTSATEKSCRELSSAVKKIPDEDIDIKDITAIDAHAGVGGVALYIARHVKKVYGVEVIPEAVSDAKRNAELSGINNAEFILGAAETVIPGLLSSGESFDVIFLDPPRKGCGAELINAIIEAQIKTVVYISCDPATMARDIKILADGGYVLKSVQPVDMFPQTSKVETVVRLEIIG